MAKNVRFVLLAIQGILTILFILLISYSLYLAFAQGTEVMSLLPYFIPALIHLLITFTAALLLSLFYRTNIGAEAQFLPILFLVIALENVKILPIFFNSTHFLMLNYEWIAIVFQFCFLFSSFLFLASSLFIQNMNATKMGQYVFVAASWSLFLSIIVPISTNASSYYKVISIASKPFVAVGVFISLLAIMTFLLSFVRDKDQRHFLARCVSFAFIIAGNTTITLAQNLPTMIIGLVLYTFGIITLLLITRTYHIWA
ncbi:hypothetical protein SpiGrapes_1894 [Sphaerochaeta pleomorpha str. Grapes]|uniref:Uncharacterized protein n=1 Tax=Sphaerochaeta pleomorpha (strain ATCC BAA-1885 / DSM 22778 / Grapes) TaxID=158190 RepID=G8QYR1_SPHPG|nr:hypothetical protein [Sphaerochaeta pleomorpha]AEV29688.1 hypothetical protein SpiGrapes_1894 [Sphaerochaeta pleomorpha str. Grapes]